MGGGHEFRMQVMTTQGFLMTICVVAAHMGRPGGGGEIAYLQLYLRQLGSTTGSPCVPKHVEAPFSKKGVALPCFLVV